MTTIETVLLAVIAGLTSTNAWQFFGKRAEQKRLQDKQDEEAKHLYRDDLRTTVTQLRDEVKNSLGEITRLSAELAEYKVRTEFLELEVKRLELELENA